MPANSTLEPAYDLCVMQDHFLFSYKYTGIRKITIYLALFYIVNDHWGHYQKNIFLFYFYFHFFKHTNHLQKQYKESPVPFIQIP